MKPSVLSQLLLYRYRYLTGYAIFGFLLVTVIVSLAFIAPHQLSSAEQTSAVQSAGLDFNNLRGSNLINAPYHLLQHLSLQFLGISDFAIKLPSLVIGALSGLCIFFFMQRWLLRPSIAILTSLIGITTGLFLLTSATGTPLIMLIFWPALLMLLLIQIASRPNSLWLYIVFAFAAGLSLYTPLSIYLLISVVLASILHPRLRFFLSKIPPLTIVAAVVVGLITIAPLLIAGSKNPSLLIGLAGFPEAAISRSQIGYNLGELAKGFLLFWKPSLSDIGLVPLFAIPAFMLILLGGLKLIVSHYTARSYQLALLVPLLFIPIILQPKFVVILFVPLLMLMSRGIEYFTREWYRLFPHNPYARIVILVPLIVLLGSIVIVNFTNYQTALYYSPQLASTYSRDLQLSRNLAKKYSAATLLVSPDEKAFFGLLQQDYPNLHVVSQAPIAQTSQPLIVSAQAEQASPTNLVPQFIAVDEYKDHQPRFYVYAP